MKMLNELIANLHQQSLAISLTMDDMSQQVFCLLEKPILYLAEEQESEGWGDEENYIQITAFIPGHLFWDGLLDTNKYTYGLCMNTYSIGLKVNDDEIESLKVHRDDLGHACWLENRVIIEMENVKEKISEDFLSNIL